jgi:molybdopterin synthase sulfur carrier subunit
MITVLYFARLREALGTASEQMALPTNVRSIDARRAHLIARGGVWADELEKKAIRAAINQTMASGDSTIADGDEIAFFPPVTGG